MDYTLLNRDDLPGDGSTFDFEGAQYDTDVSFIWVDMQPGENVRLHSHPYKEVFIIQDGQSTFTLGAETLVAHAGQIIIAPADVPHKFFNSGATPLRQIDIHVARHVVTHWLED